MSFEPWVDELKQQFKSKNITLHLERQELIRHYQEGRSVEQMVHVNSMKTIKPHSAIVQLSWRDENGRQTFVTASNHALRDEYKLIPEFKLMMDVKKKV